MIGISYIELLNMDIRYYNNCIEGYISRRENEMNDMQLVGHRTAGKIAQAVWNSKRFSNSPDRIRLRPETREEKLIKTLRAKGVI